MRRMVRRRVGIAPVGLLMLVVVGVQVLVSGPARAQVPKPLVPSLPQRSGLVSRFQPIEPTLPRDPDRDVFYDTRWADYPEVTHPNCYKHNGLYGLPWAGDCTASVYPYFWGSPGQSTIGPGCRPKHYLSRWVQNFVHPFKPVGMYYQNGNYVPIYDLDPLVTGPGPFPWSHFLRPPAGG